jgi:hypothetical protein
VLAELGGSLFATGGEVDKWFQPRSVKDASPSPKLVAQYHGHESGACSRRKAESIPETVLNRLADRIAQHIRSGPEREQAALRLANSR